MLRRLALIGGLLCFGVVVLGAYVRLSAAGLGCPDWPGCYGHLTPIGAQQADVAVNVGKAWREMLHRYAASTLVIVIVLIAAFALRGRRTFGRQAANLTGGYGIALLGIVVLQAILGMLTVTLQLKPLIVTLHLLFGLTTLTLLWWLWFSLNPTRVIRPPLEASAAARSLRGLVAAALIVLVVQIALGGWTSSNYAALACPDLPTCQGAWWPETDYRNAFVLWRGLAVNYEGGILQNPARVAIHLTHRIGAVVTACILLLIVAAVFSRRALSALRPYALLLLAALLLQLAIGITMVLKAFPLPIAVAHNAGAAFLLLCLIALYRKVCDIAVPRARAL